MTLRLAALSKALIAKLVDLAAVGTDSISIKKVEFDIETIKPLLCLFPKIDIALTNGASNAKVLADALKEMQQLNTLKVSAVDANALVQLVRAVMNDSIEFFVS